MFRPCIIPVIVKRNYTIRSIDFLIERWPGIFFMGEKLLSHWKVYIGRTYPKNKKLVFYILIRVMEPLVMFYDYQLL